MDKMLFDVLNYVNEGIIILNDKLEILFWNAQMERITDIKQHQVINNNVFKVVPNLNRSYFKKVFTSALEKDCKFFFSSAMHRGLISNNFELNLKINRFESYGAKYLIIECIDVTSQFIRINQLKKYADRLFFLNKKLMEKEKEIKKLAYYDKLTGVANRALFYNLAEKLIASAERNKKILGLMFIDIDNFKSINDMYGHRVGDMVLIETANILAKSTRAYDIVARYGGDEFLVLLPDLKDHCNYKTIATRIAKANKKVNINDDIEINISLSIGVSFYPQDGKNIDELMSKADKAMYNVKNIGGNKCLRYFSVQPKA